MVQAFENGYFKGKVETELEAGKREFERLEEKIDSLTDKQEKQSKEIEKIKTALLVIVILSLVTLPENVAKFLAFLKGLLF